MRILHNGTTVLARIVNDSARLNTAQGVVVFGPDTPDACSAEITRLGLVDRPAPVDPTVTADKMATAWANLPDEVKTAFEPVREMVNWLLRQSGKSDAVKLAWNQINAVTVTSEVQPYKDAMLSMLA